MGPIVTDSVHLDIFQASQDIARPLVSTQEDCAAATDPSYPRAYSRKEGAWTRLA